MNGTHDSRTSFKENRRKWEFSLISQAMLTYYPANIEPLPDIHRRPAILEFGSGPSSGAEFLHKMGKLTVSDIYRHPLLNLPEDVEFVISDIHNTQFSGESFDVLVSNQVLEHLERLDIAFKEMQRITKANGHFFFSIPTATWLVLTIPGQLFKKVENVFNNIIRRNRKKKMIDNNENCSSIEATDKNTLNGDIKTTNKSLLGKFQIGGHGCYPNFFNCFGMFKINNWRNTLLSNGFEIIKETPLLTYGSSHFPLIPTNRFLAKYGFPSSYLFVCKKQSVKSMIPIT